MEYLYILIRVDEIAYKVGITNNIEKRLKLLEKEFEKIDYEKSSVFNCNSRKLIEQIESGIHAFLHNHYYSPETIGGGSTEWFYMNSYKKCIEFINIFSAELPQFKLIGSLNDFLSDGPDYKSNLEILNKNLDFLNQHKLEIEKLDSFIRIHKDTIQFRKTKGQLILSSPFCHELTINPLPLYQWVTSDESKIMFDIKVYNEWKKSGYQKDLRNFVSSKFFSEFILENLDKFYQ